LRGLALVLYGIAIAWTVRVPWPIGGFIAVAGLCYIVLGWMVGITGFTAVRTLSTNFGYGCLLAFTIWLLIVGWTLKEEGSEARRSRASRTASEWS
jgi:hypothetical protein